MSLAPLPAAAGVAYSPPGTVRALWLIARRGALESLRDRTTMIIRLLFALALPIYLERAVIAPIAADPNQQAGLGAAIADMLLVVGLFNSMTAVNVAAGVFAGEKEKGNLTPLLAAPVSNLAIFGGKILAALLPALLFTLVAEVAFLAATVVNLGGAALNGALTTLALVALLLVPVIAIMGAGITSIISSRVRTYTAASTISSLVTLPVWIAVLWVTGVVLGQQDGWLVAIVLLALADGALIAVGALTWRREEVLAKL